MSDAREKKMLSNRKKEKDGGWLNQLSENVGEVIEGVGNVASKSASKVGEVLRRGYHELATPRYVENREQVIDEKVKGKK